MVSMPGPPCSASSEAWDGLCQLFHEAVKPPLWISPVKCADRGTTVEDFRRQDVRSVGVLSGKVLALRIHILSLAPVLKALISGWWHMLETVALGRQKMEVLWSSLASQACLRKQGGWDGS